jgi:DNA-directed RNA polymerase subunit RPC12/RpoP
MAVSFHNDCPECGHRALDIYVDEPTNPPSKTPFSYLCPKCNKTIVCHPEVFDCDVTMPPDALKAKRESSKPGEMLNS